MNRVRCKLVCHSVKKQLNWNGNTPFLYEYEMGVVYGDSEENKQFFASTPTGSLKIGSVRDDLFVPGMEYYLDFTPAGQK